MSTSDSTKLPKGLVYLPHRLRSKPFLTAREVRDALRCEPKTIRRYLQEGKLKARRINSRRFLYETDSVLDLLSNGH